MQSTNAKKMEKQQNELHFFERYGFLFGEKTIPQGMFYPLHWHDYFECEILLEGRAEYRCNEEMGQICTGDAYVLSYEDTHSIRVLDKLRIFAIRFREDLLPAEVIRLLSEKSVACRCHFDENELAYIRTRLEHIQKQDSQCSLYKPIMSVLLSELILMILERSPAAKENPLPSLVQKTVSYVRHNFRDSVSLASAARMLSVTPKYLGAVFKKTMHFSFHDFLNNTRLRHACHLLSTTELSVKEIAFASGYASVEYFLDVFKCRMGLSPSAYRAQYRPDTI